ncbi:hypothetical protein CRUP_016062 [Coryphaenoides rupestris]|nr:hypothetical protein CRUP_016062 [Coryphaenoides rupestris]
MASTALPTSTSTSPLYPTASYHTSAPFALNLTTSAVVTLSTLTPAPMRYSAQFGVAILSLALALGLPGNLFVVWSVVWRVRRKKRSVTCLLVLNLAVADALVLLGSPLFLRYLTSGRGWEFGGAACKLVHYLSSVNMYVSIYLIALMSGDRCLAVARPFAAQRLRTHRTLLATLLAVTLGKACTTRVFQYLLETLMGFAVPSLHRGLLRHGGVSPAQRVFQRRGAEQPPHPAHRRRLRPLLDALPLINVMEVSGLLQGNGAVVRAAREGRPHVTAFAYFSSAINPVLYVFAGSSPSAAPDVASWAACSKPPTPRPAPAPRQRPHPLPAAGAPPPPWGGP